MYCKFRTLRHMLRYTGISIQITIISQLDLDIELVDSRITLYAKQSAIPPQTPKYA